MPRAFFNLYGQNGCTAAEVFIYPPNFPQHAGARKYMILRRVRAAGTSAECRTSKHQSPLPLSITLFWEIAVADFERAHVVQQAAVVAAGGRLQVAEGLALIRFKEEL